MLFVLFSFVQKDAAICSCWDPRHIYVYDYSGSMEIGSPKPSSIQMESQLSVRVINAEYLILKVGHRQTLRVQQHTDKVTSKTFLS